MVSCFGCVVRSWCCFFLKQKTAYERRISDWSSDVCSSDLDDKLPGAAGQLFDPAVFPGAVPILAGRKARADAKAAASGFISVGDRLRAVDDDPAGRETGTLQIGRASCRARVCQYV